MWLALGSFTAACTQGPSAEDGWETSHVASGDKLGGIAEGVLLWKGYVGIQSVWAALAAAAGVATVVTVAVYSVNGELVATAPYQEPLWQALRWQLLTPASAGPLVVFDFRDESGLSQAAQDYINAQRQRLGVGPGTLASLDGRERRCHLAKSVAFRGDIQPRFLGRYFASTEDEDQVAQLKLAAKQACERLSVLATGAWPHARRVPNFDGPTKRSHTSSFTTRTVRGEPFDSSGRCRAWLKM